MGLVLGNYDWTIAALGLTGVMMLIQCVVADVAGMKVGHKAGRPVPADVGSFHFRATRALANTNETVAIFIVLALAGILSNANSGWLNGGAGIYLASRIGHMGCYYADQRTARSAMFAISLVGLLGMGLATLPALF